MMCFSLSFSLSCVSLFMGMSMFATFRLFLSDIPEALEKAKGYVEELDALCKKSGFSRLEVSELFSLNDERIDFFVFGGDSVQQLKEVVEISEREDLPESLKNELRERFADIERSIIMPSLWNIRKS
ncbi:MAG: hypothetical protein U9N62_01270 [Thermotogota bacterium]|nr:hypothetical protein [Thermotogota bacterium]